MSEEWTPERESSSDRSETIARLTKDLRDAAKIMTVQEARLLVDSYYAMQKMRIQNGNRSFAMKDEPHAVLVWFTDQAQVLEKQVAAALDRYSGSQQRGEWLRSVHGIGPVIAAGLMAHLDVREAPTVGHFWRFAGLDPTLEWKKGQKRPYNASLKTLCWKTGDSFKKFSGSDKCVYGGVYRQRKEYEVKRNDSGGNAEEAKRTMESGRKLTDDQKSHYSKGKLPPGRIDLRAMRYATKQFLSDLHLVWYRIEYGKDPPAPYPISYLGHVHQRTEPLHPMKDDWKKKNNGQEEKEE